MESMVKMTILSKEDSEQERNFWKKLQRHRYMNAANRIVMVVEDSELLGRC